MKDFYCYSIQLKNFLKLQGLQYSRRGIHYKTKKTFWVFPPSARLDNALSSWNDYKDFMKRRETNVNTTEQTFCGDLS